MILKSTLLNRELNGKARLLFYLSIFRSADVGSARDVFAILATGWVGWFHLQVVNNVELILMTGK